MQCHPGGHWHPESSYNAKVLQDCVKIGSVAGERGGFPLKRRPSLPPWLFAFGMYNVYMYTRMMSSTISRVYTGMILRCRDYEIVLVSSPFLLDEIKTAVGTWFVVVFFWFWKVILVESWAKELMFTILSSAGSHVHRRPRGSSEVAEEQSWWTGGRVASHKNSPWQMDMHVYIFYLWNNQKRGVESTFRACELPSSKMYLTPMQLAGMNLPSFRHVVVAWKNFNDTQYDTIHGLYLWSS